MKWFQVKEQSAGEKRLLLSWFLYKIFGEKILYTIAFGVGFFTFLFAPKIREFSKKYFKIIESQTGLKPNLINQCKHILSYANSLIDKMLVFAGDFDTNKISFENKNDENLLFEDINKNKGVFFICNHIGNIEILQAFCKNRISGENFNIDVFLSNKQSRIFNNFINHIKTDFPLKIFSVEDIDINTGIELKENLEKGDIVFIAGDRLAENNDSKNIETSMFSHKIFLPKGTFKLAKLMDVTTYFISAIKIKGNYKIFLEKHNPTIEKDLVSSYTKFMEKVILVNPFQFFHFYDFFN